jgi:hypothetical protein
MNDYRLEHLKMIQDFGRRGRFHTPHRVAFQWNKHGPGVALSPPGLFGALAVQLIYAVSRSNGLLVRSNCGNPFISQRRRDMSRRIYCPNPECGRGGLERRRAIWSDQNS